MRRLPQQLAAALFTLCALFGVARAGEQVFIPVSGGAVRLQAFIYGPAGRPVLIYNHGSSGGHPKSTQRARRQAEFFVARGFTVIIPMRRGRGASTGESLESEEKNCDLASWKPGLAASFDDLTAVIHHARTLTANPASPILLAGASRGGFLSVAYAAQGPLRDQVAGVISFAGGWVAQAEDQCPQDFNATSFATFGAQASAPMLWIYGDQDPFYEAGSAAAYADRFRAAGGRLTLVRLSGQGHDVAEHPRLWTDAVDAFLAPFRGATVGR